jgi:hypothetical protein
MTASILGVGENQVNLELVPVANGMGTATLHGEPSKLSCMPHVWQVEFDKCWYRDFPPHISVCTLPYQQFMHFCLPWSKGEQYWSPRCDDQWH